MSHFDTFRKAKKFLEEQGRVSLRLLQRELTLDGPAFDELVAELVEVQRVAEHQGQVLVWVDGATQRDRHGQQPTAGSAVEAERRQLTVMFCDLVGSSALSARIDAEDYREVVRAYQASASEVIDSFDGHIAQFLGDGLLVYFGYPLAHEDDAARAVRAGRKIVSAMGRLNDRLEPAYGVRLAVRLGIHTGPVVVGEMGSGAKRETLALGATTNIAARIESVAEPDSIVISEATQRLVRGLFVTRDLGTPQLAGINEPIRLHAVMQATAARSRLDVDPDHLTPLVGREREVALLLSKWADVEQGNGRAVLLSGEAGVGKSRLARALRDHLSGQPHRWLECYAGAATQSSAFFPLIELLEHELGFTSTTAEETKLARLESALESTGIPLPESVPFLGQLLHLKLPEDRYPPRQEGKALQRRSTMVTLCEWLTAAARRRPLVLLAEDLHWSDPSTIESLGLLMERSLSAPTLLLITTRPEFDPPFAADARIFRINLARLPTQAAEGLIACFTPLPLPQDLVARIVERADGVPLHLEELTQTVLESNLVVRRDDRYELSSESVALTMIPMTLQDSLMARLDRLSHGKVAAQHGAVIGRDFTYQLLAAMTTIDEADLRCGIDQLVDAGLLYRRGEPPQSAYGFKHALVRDVAYASLLRNGRRALHGRVADVLKDRFNDRAAGESERIARHLDEAGRAAEAIGFYQLAAKQAAERSAHQEAIVHLNRAIVLLQPATTSDQTTTQASVELDLQIALGPSLMAVRGYSAPEVRGVYERAVELCDAADASPRIAPVLAGLWAHAVVTGAFPKALALSDRLLAIADGTQNEDLLIESHVLCGVTRSYTGPMTESLRHLETASAMYDAGRHAWHAQVYGQNPLMASRSYSGLALWWLGSSDLGGRVADEAIEYARTINHPRSLAFSLANGARCHLKRGDYTRCLEIAHAAADISVRQGYPDFKAMGELHVAFAQYRLDDGPPALERIQSSLAALIEVGNSLSMPYYQSLLADAQSAEGRFEDAWSSLRMAEAALARHVNDSDEAEVYRVKGLVVWRQAEAGVSAAQSPERYLEQALDTARTQGAASWSLQAATTLARYRLASDCDASVKSKAADVLTEAMSCVDGGTELRPWQEAARVLERARK